MYELIPAGEEHLDQITPLLLRTGYWEADLKYNSLKLSAYDFMRELIAKPHLPFTTLIVEHEARGKVLGVIVCASKHELETLSADWINKIDPSVITLFKNLVDFELTDSYHISFIAAVKEARGRGLGKRLLNFAESKSKALGIETLSLFTINCQTSAIKLYLNMGMVITKVVSLDERLPFPYALYFEKNETLLKRRDYFDTDAYKQLDLKKLKTYEKN